MYNVIMGLHVLTLTESSPGPRVLDLYKECTMHCGIPNAYNNRSKVPKNIVYNTEYM